ncbi:hypothetical protein Pla52n_09610 [Stieleria varia]|uniref:Uncharacterized protein n=1 Tax=Stieleria varia TaxID=2528005 RepID=A0A5C6BAS4_9BACT|nr:hypothetical protein Pla52n_09610 [Stieleria varia]
MEPLEIPVGQTQVSGRRLGSNSTMGTNACGPITKHLSICLGFVSTQT